MIVACELGLVAQVFVEKLTLSLDEVDQLELEVQGPQQFDSCTNQDRLEFQIVYSDFLPDGRPELSISNHGLEPIYYIPDDLWIRDYPLHNIYPAQEMAGYKPWQEMKLEPGDGTSFPLATNDEPFEIVFRYRLGEARSFRSFVAYFKGFVPEGCRF